MEFALIATSLSLGAVHAGCCSLAHRAVPVPSAVPAPGAVLVTGAGSARPRGGVRVDPLMLASMSLMLLGMADVMIGQGSLLPGVAWVTLMVVLAGPVLMRRGRGDPLSGFRALHLVVMAVLTAAMVAIPGATMVSAGHAHGGGALPLFAMLVGAGYLAASAVLLRSAGEAVLRVEVITGAMSVLAMTVMLLWHP